MAGPSIEQAKKALEVFLRGMTAGTRFNIYRFGSSFEKLFPSSIDYNTDNVNAALDSLSRVVADLGGTELLGPLTDIYRRGSQKEGTRSIVLLTDGQIGNEQQVLNLAKSDSGTRLFTVGIGYGPNEYLVKQLAALSGGATEMVSPGERIEPKVLRLFGKVTKSAVEDLVVDWGMNADQTPLRPVVHEGECVSLFARVPAGRAFPEVLRLRGKVDGRQMSWDVPVVRVEQSGASLPLLWARARISDLEEGVVPRGGSRQQYRREKTLENEVIALSKQYGILSRGTSFVTVEVRADAEKTGGEIVLRKVPGMLTRGWGGLREDVADAFSYRQRAPRVMKGTHAHAMPFSFLQTVRCQEPCEPDRLEVEHQVRTGSVPCPQSTDELGEILALQTATGGFDIRRAHDADLLGLDRSALQEALGKMVNGGDDPRKLLVTAVVFALLERRFRDRRDEWFEVAEKSRRWLRTEVARLNPTVDSKPLEDWAKAYASGMAR
jgi:hypothetical protein